MSAVYPSITGDVTSAYLDLSETQVPLSIISPVTLSLVTVRVHTASST